MAIFNDDRLNHVFMIRNRIFWLFIVLSFGLIGFISDVYHRYFP